jgi:hypothetical protein
MEGIPVKKPKLSKAFVVKQAVGFIFAAAIGYAIKMEKKIETRIDEHYSEPKPDQQDN